MHRGCCIFSGSDAVRAKRDAMGTERVSLGGEWGSVAFIVHDMGQGSVAFGIHDKLFSPVTQGLSIEESYAKVRPATSLCPSHQTSGADRKTHLRRASRIRRRVYCQGRSEYDLQ